MRIWDQKYSGAVVLLVVTIVAAQLFLAAGCGSDKPTKPGTKNMSLLAGGGRASSNDEFIGGPGVSGPNDSIPTAPPDTAPDSKYIPIFFGDFYCQIITDNKVISNDADWHAFWDSAMDCARPGRPILHTILADTLNPDSVIIQPDSNFYPPDTGNIEPLPVDFSKDVVIAITISPETRWGRGLYLTDVKTSGSGTAISYLVRYPGEDCYALMDPFPTDSLHGDTTYLTAAFVVPKFPLENITWNRSDTTYSCSWHPDLTQPLVLYYTDAICDLGSTEHVITTKTDLDDWANKALGCDQRRWFGGGLDTLYGGKDSVVIGPGDTTITPPFAPIDFDVDFTKCAVIILRGGSQTQWGGGIWLNDFKTTDAGTTIEYSVMQPGTNCPAVGVSPMNENGAVNPTVAIRVPLPINEPIRWVRNVQTIDCDWHDTTLVHAVGPH